MKVLAGSLNPVKIQSAEEAFSKFFEEIEVEGMDVNSGVPDQPLDENTFIGAENRAEELYKINRSKKLEADYFVGIEGGIGQTYHKWLAYGGICIMDSKKRKAFGTSPQFELPQNIVEQLVEGKELGDVIDELTKIENSKHKFGAIGYFTNGVMDRKELYVNGIIAALVPFLNEGLYF